MVIFHSYVTLPEGMDVRPPKKMKELQDVEGRKNLNSLVVESLIIEIWSTDHTPGPPNQKNSAVSSCLMGPKKAIPVLPIKMALSGVITTLTRVGRGIRAQSPKISASSGDGIGPGGYMPLIPLHRNLVAGKSVDSADLRVLFRVHGVMMLWYMDCGCWWSCCCAVITLCGSPPDIAITCTDRCFALDLLPKKINSLA